MNQKTKPCLVLLALVAAFIFPGCGPDTSSKQLELDHFIKALVERGMEIGDPQEKWYQMIMATDGYGISVNGQSIQVYQFDTEIQSGRDAIKKWELEGVRGQRVIAHHNLMIFLEPKHEKWEEILEVFQSL